MKKMIWSIFTLILLVFANCQDVTIGYLLTEDASYQIDSMVIKLELDSEAPVMVRNETYWLYRSWGISHESCISMGEYPEIAVGGGEDYIRDKYGIPWVSTPIEGVEGTDPVIASVKNITSPDGEVEKMKAVLSVRGNGVFSIPAHHEIPRGRYTISLNFSNEGYSKDVDNCFVIIVI